MLAPVTEIFCDIDDFCKDYLKNQSKYLLPNPERKRDREMQMSFCLTKGNVDDRAVVRKLMANLKGLGAGDKGYLGQKLADDLAAHDLKFITKVRKNMKKKMYAAFETFFLVKVLLWA